MKKLILLLLTVSLLSCSTESEYDEGVDRGTFRVPRVYQGYYENANSGLYLDIEEYKIEFNIPNGEVIIVTRGQNMAQVGTYPVTFDGKIVELDLRGSSVYLWYFDWDNTVIYFEHGYADAD